MENTPVMEQLTTQTTPEASRRPGNHPRDCDHCEEAPVRTFRIMHGPLGPHELGLCDECAASFDEVIATQEAGR